MKEIKVTIDERNLGLLNEEVERINKELNRYHYPLLKMDYTKNEEFSSRKDESYLDCVVYSEFEKTNLIGEDVNFEGVIDYMSLGDDNTKILSVKNEFIGHYMQHEKCTCDKCKKNIARGKYIVFSKDVDEVKSRNDFYILGTKCAKAYFPFNIEAYIERVSKGFNEISSFDEFGDGERSWHKTHLNPYDVAYAVSIMTNGATTKYVKGETIEQVGRYYGLLTSPSLTTEEKAEMEYYESKNTIFVSGKELLDNAKSYYDSLPSSNDYYFNCKVLLNNLDNIGNKYFGRLVAAIVCGNIGFNKRIEREEEHKKNIEQSEFVGEVGAKFDRWELTFKKVFSFDSQWGFSNIYKFVDSNNNTIVWSTANSLMNKDHHPLVEGDKVVLKGTIKAHKVYRDEKQTCITRCKEVL